MTEDSQFCVNCGVAVIAPSSPTLSAGEVANEAAPILEPNIPSSPSGGAIAVAAIPVKQYVRYRSRTRIIKKFASLSVIALFFSGYLVFFYAPSKGFKIDSNFSLIGFAIGLGLVLLPSILAAYSDHPKFVWVMLVNVFFSWTIIFWIVSLIWSVRGWRSRFAVADSSSSSITEFPTSSAWNFRGLFRIDLSERWYVVLLKVCIAVIGAYVLVAVVFLLYGFIGGFIQGILGTLH